MEVYLDNAATSAPKPQSVLDAVMNALTNDNANPGRSGHARAIRAASTVFRTRESLCRLLNAPDPLKIAFTFNCTDALNLAIKGLLDDGAHVICSWLEHNSVLRVLGEMQKDGKLECSFIKPTPEGFIDPAAYAQAIRANTRLIILTHASNVTGAVQPVRAVGGIAKMHGIPYLIDGAQALGEIDADVSDLQCSLYAFPGHKGLLGPQGTGGLYIADGVKLKTLREGGTGSSSESILQPEELPERYEAGTVNLPGLAGLEAGCGYVYDNRVWIRAHAQALSQMLLEGLRAISGVTLYSPVNPLFRTGTVSFNVNDLPSQEAAEFLAASGIAVRAGLHCAPYAHKFLNTENRGAVRASVGCFNTESDIDALLAAVHELAKTSGPT